MLIIFLKVKKQKNKPLKQKEPREKPSSGSGAPVIFDIDQTIKQIEEKKRKQKQIEDSEKQNLKRIEEVEEQRNQKQEQKRLEREKLELKRLEQEKQSRERLEREKLELKRLEQEKQERVRQARERQEQEKLEYQRKSNSTILISNNSFSLKQFSSEKSKSDLELYKNNNLVWRISTELKINFPKIHDDGTVLFIDSKNLYVKSIREEIVSEKITEKIKDIQFDGSIILVHDFELSLKCYRFKNNEIEFLWTKNLEMDDKSYFTDKKIIVESTNGQKSSTRKGSKIPPEFDE